MFSRQPLRTMVSADSYRVEPVLVRDCYGDLCPLLRVSWRGDHIADCASVGDVEQLVDLEMLEAVSW